MTRIVATLPIIALAAMTALCAPQPAAAQDSNGTGSERVNMVIVYGDDPCPVAHGDDIIVCARKPESEKYRIPAPFRGEDPNSSPNMSWAEKATSFERVGQAGINSCSAVGSGGPSGCLARFIHDAYAEKKRETDVNFGKALADARAKRAATIDSSAAAEQARVEELEKEYDAKKAAQAEAEAKAIKATGATGEVAVTPGAHTKAPPPPEDTRAPLGE